MKKTNRFTLLLLCISMLIVVLFMGIKSIWLAKEVKNSDVKQEEVHKQEKPAEKKPDKEEASDSKENAVPAPTPISMDDALFIGDSRTVGLMEYSQIPEADYFCSVGMSVFNIHDEAVSVPNVGKLTLTELLNNKTYKKIYIMLGINEMGYKFENILAKYEELIDFVKEKEAAADIILLGNLHVTQSRSQSDEVFNNAAINRLNQALSKLAKKKKIAYFDANVLFDDENGALAQDKSSDDTHLYAKYYEEWGKWIKEQTALLLKEE